MMLQKTGENQLNLNPQSSLISDLEDKDPQPGLTGRKWDGARPPEPLKKVFSREVVNSNMGDQVRWRLMIDNQVTNVEVTIVITKVNSLVTGGATEPRRWSLIKMRVVSTPMYFSKTCRGQGQAQRRWRVYFHLSFISLSNDREVGDREEI